MACTEQMSTEIIKKIAGRSEVKIRTDFSKKIYHGYIFMDDLLGANNYVKQFSEQSALLPRCVLSLPWKRECSQSVEGKAK